MSGVMTTAGTRPVRSAAAVASAWQRHVVESFTLAGRWVPGVYGTFRAFPAGCGSILKQTQFWYF